MSKGNILVAVSPGLSQGFRNQFLAFARRAELPTMNVRFVDNLTSGMRKRSTATQLEADPAQAAEFRRRLAVAVTQYGASLVVLQDWAALSYITNGRHDSCDTVRGSVYVAEFGTRKLPIVVTDAMRVNDGPRPRGALTSKLAVVPHAGFVLLQDLKKAARWYNGTVGAAPPFTHRILESVQSDGPAFLAAAQRAVLIGMDVETSGTGHAARVVCSGYAMLQADGSVECWTVPLAAPFRDAGGPGCWWDDASFGAVYRLLQQVHALPVPKCLQNGSYDANYYIRYRLPPCAWVLDSAVAFHSFWPELPKRLDYIASMFCDTYRYWKDEAAGEEDDDDKSTKVPQTEAGYRMYLRYNGLDCYYTLLSSVALMRMLLATPWAMENYRRTMRKTLGPAALMSYAGVRVNSDMQQRFEDVNTREAAQALADLQLMAATPDFNANSDDQVRQLIYGVYKAQPLPRKGKAAASRKSTAPPVDEKTLQILQTQHPVLSRIIEQVWAAKKPANMVSKYGVFRRRDKNKWGGLRLWQNRWLYKMNAAGTKSFRYASKASDFWIGTQIQNPPYEVRALVEPDPGYVLWQIDYSKADFWHTAFASEEPEMMRLALDASIDTHCYHAAKFFSMPYEKVYEAYKRKEPWVVHSTHGVRQNTKRIVYGANYLMGGYTLFLVMGKESVDATAKAAGRNTAGWGIREYTDFCQGLVDFYYSKLYPNLLPWLERACVFVQSHGSRVALCGAGTPEQRYTRTLFRDPVKDPAAQRELASLYGQTGTASTCDAAFDDLYYRSGLIDGKRCTVLVQMHDSAMGQIREDCLHLLPQIKRCMEVTNYINGRKFVIPTEMEVGYGWGYRMTGWHENITLEEIRKGDERWKTKNPALSA